MSGKKKEKSDRRLSRSLRLRKYEAVYRKCMKGKSPKKHHKTRHSSETKERQRLQLKEKDSSKRKKKALNSYQKFVREESSKEKYRTMRASERLSVIAAAWEHKKRYGRRKK